MANCQLCNRKAETKEFCQYHKVAYETLKQNYDIWCDAYSKLSWEEYLERLLKSKETGSWIKDVINLELKKREGFD